MTIARKVLEAYESGRFQWVKGGERTVVGDNCECLLTAEVTLAGVATGRSELAGQLGFTRAIDMVHWNDAPNTTYADVLARLRAASEGEVQGG